ncbi:ComF family protein [Luteipulveratus mongoliensis]|uniref:Uncharacterized protein n=1 Tax=Luteipulveratus mongoliensis TaxID=571913 RepID=A0A0K1JI30_9MICO|nr:phosphoribosyltransferase family protein [Luteipulveratus mongoliensis]AKU16235.1 hypothetical protein VV02_10785 [Luteipulveratus mongoliensis]
MTAAHALLDLVLPRRCAGCDAPGDGWCADCRDEVARRRRGPARPTRPSPAPDGFPPTWAMTTYEDPVRRAIVEHKDSGRADLVPLLAAWWRDAAAGALSGDPHACAALGQAPVFVVPAPSSGSARRQRGRDPWAEVTRAAVAGVSTLSFHRCLTQVRRVADQSGLDAAARWDNLHAAMAVRDPGPLRGAVCLVSDDVLTSGATLTEASRALYAAGARHVCAAVLAATQRRPRTTRGLQAPGRLP